LTTLLSSLLLAVCWAASAGWTPASWTAENTVQLTTDVPAEGAYTFPVWLVVIDGQAYVRLGPNAAGRGQESKRRPLLLVPAGPLRRRRGGRAALRPGALRAGARSGAPRRGGHRAEVLERRRHPLHVAPAHVPARARVSAQPARSASSTMAGCASALATFAQ